MCQALLWVIYVEPHKHPLYEILFQTHIIVEKTEAEGLSKFA